MNCQFEQLPRNQQMPTARSAKARISGSRWQRPSQVGGSMRSPSNFQSSIVAQEEKTKKRYCLKHFNLLGPRRFFRLKKLLCVESGFI